MKAFNHENFINDLSEYETKFFDVIVDIFDTKEPEYSKAFFNNLFPIGENLEKY